MSVQLQVSQVIDRPVAKVFQFCAHEHVRNHPHGDPDIELKQVSDGPIGLVETGYLVSTDEVEFEAANVVIATGSYQQPKVPSFSTNLSSEIHQLHSSEYRNPEALPAGAVLVVGSAQSGAQIAEELYQRGRKVYLSVSSAGRLPRRYRGKDVTRWLDELGFADRTVDKLPSPKAKFAGSAHGTGKDGGHTINLHQFARDGVVLLGHIQSAEENRITLASDLKEDLAKADKFEAGFVWEVDNYIMIDLESNSRRKAHLNVDWRSWPPTPPSTATATTAPARTTATPIQSDR